MTDSDPITEALSAAAGPTRPANQPSRAVDRRAIEREIAAGLPNQSERMRDARACLRYSMARFEEFPTRHKDARYKSPAVRRTSPIFKRIMEVLTMHLYKSQPTRKLRDPMVSEWLEQVYRRNNCWAKLRRLDQLTLIGGFGALQFVGGTDPKLPLDIRLWGADQIAYWVSPTDPTKVEACATLDLFDNQRHLKLWTRDETVEYITAKGLLHPATGGTAYREVSGSRKPNPYVDREGQGIIPFAFAHWQFPAQEFEESGPGLNLKQLNEGVNDRLDNLGESIYFNCRPIGVAEGIDEGWVPPAELRPGDFLKLPAASVDVAGNGPVPTLKYLMPDLSYVTVDWEDQNAFLDHTLEMWGVPPALVRMIQSGARSGASIQAEQLPILGWVEGRRADWGAYEEGFARTGIQVAESHLRNSGLADDANTLQATLDDWNFSQRWPPLHIQLPGPERDKADDWRLENKLISLVGIVQERQDLSEEEAFEALAKVKGQTDQLKAMGIELAPPNPFAMGGNPFGDPNQPPPPPGSAPPPADETPPGEPPNQ